MKSLSRKVVLSLLFILIILIPVAIGVVTNLVTEKPLPPWLDAWLSRWPALLILALLLIIVTLLYDRFSKPSDALPAIAPSQAARNRAAMLNLVESAWIKGVLEDSLPEAVLIELGLEDQRQAIERPVDMVLQIGQENRKLPANTRIEDVFDERGRNLLRNLIPFLDYAAERIFLRKVGGGYVFVHRLLLEYFASLAEES